MDSLSGYAPAIMGIGVAVLGYGAARLIRWKAHRDIRARARREAGEDALEHGGIVLRHAE